ncbi:MAG: twin-arginine translocase subunit TatC [Planctomycetaceae bacterium]|nr:twin-arginine translocase subunit TatC [Planctomycetaceae bacterium]
MPETDHDDWLSKTKMSFSEHLEELRTALFKSLIALVVGTLLGLLFGRSVVDYIQTPLRDSLESFYRGQAHEQNLQRLEEKKQAGEPVPEDPAQAAEKLADEGLVPLSFYVNRYELAQALGQPLPDTDVPAFATTRKELIHLRLYQPLEQDPRLKLISLSGHEPFMVYLKASIVVGAIITSPFIFYFIWEFVAAGLYHHERKYVYLFLPLSLGLFFSGSALAFFVVFDFVLDFLFWFNAQMGINPTPQISEWMSFVLLLPLGFGISFQLPLVMLFLERLGIFTVESYQSQWRIAILVIAILSMFLTPADPGSMLLMAVPLVALYFGGIELCKRIPTGLSKHDDKKPSTPAE